jgi:hypothetical protein
MLCGAGHSGTTSVLIATNPDPHNDPSTPSTDAPAAPPAGSTTNTSAGAPAATPQGDTAADQAATQFVEATKSSPCICGSTSRCQTAADGSEIRCANSISTDRRTFTDTDGRVYSVYGADEIVARRMVQPREVTWSDPCTVCGGTEGCMILPPHKIACRTIDNGLGIVRKTESDKVFEYDLRKFRQVPPADLAVKLFKRFFFNRIDIVCFLAPWNSPCPAVGDARLDKMLLAHVVGQREAVAILWRSKKNEDTTKKGAYRIGSYGPAGDGTTAWLCLDCDAGGEHSAPLADPLGVALYIIRLCERLGLPVYLERSKSAKGWHVWIFFAPAIEAKLARQLGYALAPRDADLTDGNFADTKSAVGIEIFPKCDRLKEGGVGNQVWLPWFWNAKPGGSVFYRLGPRRIVPFIPMDFETADEARVEAALAKLPGGVR